MKRLNTEDFIKKAKEVHSDKYDYSNVNYIDSKTKVCIICPTHGKFWQIPNNHLNGKGCPKCNKTQKLNTEIFIDKAKEIHGDKYDYSKVEYINSHTKVCIICKEHGEFWQLPYDHLEKKGCPKCKGKNKTNEDFIKKAKEIHGNKYDYSKVNYIDSKTKVCIICPIHGEFWQAPSNHLSGKGCILCGIQKRSQKNFLTEEEAVKRINKICEEKKYVFEGFCNKDKEKCNYQGNKTYIKLHCNKCNNTWCTTTFDKFLNGRGCPNCNKYKKIKIEVALNKIQEKCIKQNYNFIGFYKKKWIGCFTKLIIKCNKCNKIWMPTYTNFINNNEGCPYCKKSKLENDILNFLTSKGFLNIEYNKKYSWLQGLQLDFYLPEYKIAIECQGEQHFGIGGMWGKKEQYQRLLEHDNKKRKLCKENGIKLLYYSNLHIDYPYKVYEDKEELLKEIKSI